MDGHPIPAERHLGRAAADLLRLAILAAAMASLAVAGCGDQVEPPVASSMSLSPTSVELLFLGDTAVFEATVNDQHGNSMPDAYVAWSGDSARVFSVVADGPSKVLVTALANGSGRVRAASDSLAAVGRVWVEQIPTAIEVHSGDGQERLRGRPLREAVVVRVSDAGGSSVFGLSMVFAPGAGQGTADPRSAKSDSSGLASTAWTLGAQAGEQRLGVSAGHGLRTEATARALTPDEAVDTVRVHSGDGQERLRGWTLPEPVVVAVVDAWGEPVPGATIDFVPGEGGGSAEPAAAESDTSGLAATVWTLGGEVGEQVLTASVAGGPGVEVLATALAPEELVDTLAVYSGDGQWAAQGKALPEPVVVVVLDEGGSPVEGASVLFSPGEGHGTTDPDSVASDSTGLASTVWTLGGEVGEQELTASVPKRAEVEVTATAVRDEGVCARTPQVSDALTKAVGVRSCADVTAGDLAGIQLLRGLANANITNLRSGDFQGLSRLGSLNLSNNHLRSLPPDLFRDSPRIRTLELNNNEFSQVPTEALSALPELSWLWLDYNKLANLSRDAFAGLGSIKYLRLHNNGITELPPGVFGDLTQLEHLRLVHNELAGLPPDIFAGLTNLQTLALSNNRVGKLPSGIFRNLVNLHTLWLPVMGLRELEPDVFSGLSKLRTLDLENNLLRELPEGLFSGLSSLSFLDLRKMYLSELPPGIFDGLKNLETLYLHGNRLGELREGVFDGLGKLTRVFLNGNRLTRLPSDLFAGLSNLELIDMRNNTVDPLPLPVRLERWDTDSLEAPGPAEVGLRLLGGAPAPFGLPLTVQRGTASGDSVSAAAGDTVSTSVEVSRPDGSTDAVHVTVGYAPELPQWVLGLEVEAVNQLALFADTDNRSPVVRSSLPPYRLQVGARVVDFDLQPHFSDPDGDSLSYEAKTKDTAVVALTVDGNTLRIGAVGPGSANIEVAAVDPDGLRAAQRYVVPVAPAPDPDAFYVEVIFGRGFSEKQKAEIRRAADRWMEVVTGDLPDVPVEGHVQRCAADPNPYMVGSIDDLLVHVVMSGNTWGALGTASVCGVREESGLPFHGLARFNRNAFVRDEPRYSLHLVAAHEIGHTLGMGPWGRWPELLKESEDSVPDPHFSGPLAIAAFDDAGGDEYEGNKVPVEIRSESHWRESVMAAEIMSPIYGGKLLSAITVQALADIGHGVDVSEADDYALDDTQEWAGGEARPDSTAIPVDIVLRGPVVVVDRDGKVMRVIRD